MIDRYDSALDADYSPSELSGEDDPLEYDSQTEEPEPRFCEPSNCSAEDDLRLSMLPCSESVFPQVC